MQEKLEKTASNFKSSEGRGVDDLSSMNAQIKLVSRYAG